MSEIKQFKEGDRVRVTFEARYNSSNGVRHAIVLNDATRLGLPVDATVELIQPVDDPSKDPAGTVRQSPVDGLSAIKRHGPGWADLLGNGWASSEVTGWSVIGAVPGTPAWSAWRAGLLNVAPSDVPQALLVPPLPGDKRQPWVGDGSEEPPAYVKKVRSARGDVTERCRVSGWWNTRFDDGITCSMPLNGEGWDWGNRTYAGPYTEVID